MSIEDNYLEYDLLGKKMYIVKEHHYAFYGWWKVFNENIINSNLDLIHIDTHCDLRFADSHLEKSKEILTYDKNQIVDFIENDIQSNADFIIPATIGDLIGDIYCYCNVECFQKDNLVEIDQNNYKIYWKESKKLFFNDTRTLSDITENNLDLENDFILDIDLDFFTNTIGDYTNIHDNIGEQLNLDLFKNLLNKSKIITIALEPFCCGGKENCLEILKKFNEQVFKPNGLDIFEEVSDKFLG
jgi:hypothetical protein